MSEALAYMKRVIEGRSGPGGFDWDHVLAALLDAEAARTEESEQIMIELADFEGPLALSGRSANLPHALTPVDVLRSHAVQTLASWDAHRFRGPIERVAKTAQSPMLRSIAEDCLD